MQASVKEGRGSVPLCASHRRGAIAPLRIAAPAKCLDCCKRSSAFPAWLVCPSITGCKQLACCSAFEGRLQSACVPAADRLPIARPLLLDCFWSVMSKFHGSSVCAWYSVVFCSLAFLQVRDWCDDLCQYAHVAAAICDTLLLPPIFALCTAPGFQCRFSRRTRVPRRRRLTSCWTRSCYLVPLPLTVLLALRLQYNNRNQYYKCLSQTACQFIPRMTSGTSEFLSVTSSYFNRFTNHDSVSIEFWFPEPSCSVAALSILHFSSPDRTFEK